MARNGSILTQRWLWTTLMGLAALAFWIVGFGVGWRGWILSAPGGIVAKAQSFGLSAYIWWIPATVLTLTTVTMAIGAAVIRHLVDGPVEVLPEKEQLPEMEELPEKEPLSGAEASQSDDSPDSDEAPDDLPETDQVTEILREPDERAESINETNGSSAAFPATDGGEDEPDR